MSTSRTTHYHIRWSGNRPLDWERFTTAEQAESWAAQVVLHGESYSVEKFDEDCIRCKPPSEDSLHEVLDGAIKKGNAEYGTLQILDTKTGALRIVAQRGFSQRFLKFFSVIPGDFAACGTALARRERVLVDDVLTDPIFNDKALLEVMQQAKVRSVQSVPLATSAGQLVGVIAVHYRAPHMPSIPAHHLESTYIRDVADYLDRFETIREEKTSKIPR